MLRLEVAVDLAAIEAAQDRIAEWLAGEGVAAPVAYRVRLVLEELLANLVMHARFPAGPRPSHVTLRILPAGVEILLEDGAEPFDPRGTADPALPASLDDDRVGGLGLALVRKMAQIRGYHRSGAGTNVTSLLVRGGTDA